MGCHIFSFNKIEGWIYIFDKRKSILDFMLYYDLTWAELELYVYSAETLGLIIGFGVFLLNSTFISLQRKYVLPPQKIDIFWLPKTLLTHSFFFFTVQLLQKVKMSSHQEDLDLLLSLQDRVLETPPGSPSNLHSHSPGKFPFLLVILSTFNSHVFEFVFLHWVIDFVLPGPFNLNLGVSYFRMIYILWVFTIFNF